MTVAVAPNLTVINYAESITGWSEWNLGGGVNLELFTDPSREGTNSIGTIASELAANESSGGYFTAGAPINLRGKRLYVWMNIQISIQNKENGGARIIIGDGANTRAYYVGGGDALGFQVGFWNCFVLEIDNLPSGWEQIAGTGPPDVTSLTEFGASISTPIKSRGVANVFWDVIRYGTGLTITGGTAEDPVTFAQIVEDDESEATDKAYGIIREAAAGVYSVQGDLTFGDPTGSAGLYFYDTDAVVVVGAQPNQTSSGAPYKFSVVAATSESYFQLGNPVGTGDDQVGARPVQLRQATAKTGSILFTFESTDAQATQSFNFGTTFVGLNSASIGAIFATSSAGAAFSGSGLTFDRCGQVNIGSVPVRNSIFSGHSISGSGALIWTTETDIKKSAFRNNTDGTGNGSAGIEIPITGSFSFNGLTFSNNDYDILNSSNGQVTVSVVGAGDTPTYSNASGSSTKIVAETEVTLTGMSSGSEVRVYDKSSGVAVDGVENVGDTGIFSFSYTPGEVVYIVIHALSYVYILIDDYTIPTTDTTLPIEQRFDRNYSNPI